MKKYQTCIAIILLIFLCGGLWSAPRTRVAVLNFRVIAGVSNQEALTLSHSFNSSVDKTAVFDLVSRSEMVEIFKENEFNQACTSAECAVQAGKLLASEKIIIGDIGKIGRTYTITAKLIDVKSGKIEKSQTEKYSGAREGLLKTVDVLARKVAGTYKSYTWWYVGGGAVILGAAAAVLVQSLKPEPEEETGLPLPPDPPE